jgi:hypothetical protein
VRRLVWMAVGAGITIYVVRRIDRALDAASPEGIGRALNAAVDALREFTVEVREAMAEREQELRVALGVEPGTMDAEDPAAVQAESLQGPSAQGS